jgi:hypothetical protein
MSYDLMMKQQNENANDGTYEWEMQRKGKAVLTLLMDFFSLFFFLVFDFLFLSHIGLRFMLFSVKILSSMNES